LPFSLLTFFRVLDHPRIIVAKFAIESIDLFPRGKCREGPKICGKGVLFRPRGSKNGAAFLEDEFHAVPLLEAEPVANLNGHSDLPFAADGAGRRHLYLVSKK